MRDHLDTIVKSVLTGLVVAVVLTLARQGRPDIAAVLLMFPAVCGTGLLFVGLGGGSRQLVIVSRRTAAAFPVFLAFPATAWLMLHFCSWPLALAVALAVWFVAAGVFVTIVRRQGRR